MTQFFFPIGNDEIEDVRNMELNQDNVKSDNNKNLKTKEECVILNWDSVHKIDASQLDFIKDTDKNNDQTNHEISESRCCSNDSLKKTAANSLARSFLKLNLLIPLINF